MWEFLNEICNFLNGSGRMTAPRRLSLISAISPYQRRHAAALAEVVPDVAAQLSKKYRVSNVF